MDIIVQKQHNYLFLAAGVPIPMQLRLLMHAVNNRFTMISLLYYTFPIISLHQNYNYVYNYNFVYFPLEMSLQKNATVTQLNSQCQYRHHSSSHAEYIINHLYIRFAKLPITLCISFIFLSNCFFACFFIPLYTISTLKYTKNL